MDQNLARRLLVEGATLLVPGVPEGTNFGIDLKSWETGERFKGIKMIPPGLHFVYHSAVGKYGEAAPRIGFMHFFKKGELLIKKWDTSLGEIDHSKTVPSEEQDRIRANLLDIDRFLGPYPYDVWDKWKLLTNKITEELAEKLSPDSGVIRSALELIAPVHIEEDIKINEEASDIDSCDSSLPGGSSTSEDLSLKPHCSAGTSKTISLKKRCRPSRPLTVEEVEEQLLPELKPAPGTALRLTSFPEINYPPGSTPAEITRHSMDSSYALQTVLNQHTRNDDFVGELQFSFVCFLVGQSLEAFEHWKKQVVLLCGCEKALTEHHALFDDLLWALEPQLWEVQEDFLADIVSNNNAIYQGLRSLFRSIQSPDNNVEARFKTRAARFAERLTDKLSWDFSNLEEEEEDEKPIVVEV